MIIWLIGLVAAILMFPGVCGTGCDTACRMCGVVGLSITSASLHGIIGFIEAIIFWVSGLAGGTDWVAGLLLLKNIMCLSSEIVMAIVACGVQNAFNAKKAAERARQVQMSNLAQMQLQMQQMQAAGLTVSVVGQPLQPQPAMAGSVAPAPQQFVAKNV